MAKIKQPNTKRTPATRGGAPSQFSHSRIVVHRKVASESLRKLLRAPGTSGLVVVVIAVAMMLPALLLLLTSNLQANMGSVEKAAQITAYFYLAVPDDKALEVSERLQLMAEVADVDYVSASDALTEFSQALGLGATLQSLAQNPLPSALIITPARSSPDTANAIEQSLATFEAVEFVQLDYLWLQRLEALLSLVNQLGGLLLGLVAIGLVVIIGNAIRVGVESKREEIRIIKQFGGADSFIARPFLYTGLYLGAAGGLLACILLLLVLSSLGPAVAEVASLYDSDFQLNGLSVLENLLLIAAAAGLGWVSAFISVLRKIATISA
jgi:cell division transport system permease protein